MELFTLVMQIAILMTVGASLWNMYRTAYYVRQTHDLIRQYRSEIEWLKARLDQLETRASSGNLRVVQ